MSNSDTNSTPEEQGETKLVPFPPGVLTSEHEQQITIIRSCLQSWLVAREDIKKELASSRERMGSAMEELRNLKVEAPYAFTPPPPYTYRSVLLSCIKCYWLAQVASLDDAKRGELAKRLDVIPPYGKRIPQFNGTRCVEKAGELNAREYEGLMRTVVYVVLGLSEDGVAKMWRELAEVGVMTWEERD
ncbi:hypothetical protein BDZ97DRAFT_1753414 [Flammula alnicola]|nr:hypothetical protein BDZ97DRAFT_1753414 [Flammula alnicola]